MAQQFSVPTIKQKFGIFRFQQRLAKFHKYNSSFQCLASHSEQLVQVKHGIRVIVLDS